MEISTITKFRSLVGAILFLAAGLFTQNPTATVVGMDRLGGGKAVDPGQGTNFNAEWGIPGTTTDPRLVGYPLINISGYQQLGPGKNLPLLFALNGFDYGDTLSWVKGQHLLKMGTDNLHGQSNQPYWNNNRGTYAFTGAWTGQAYADFLLGYLNSDSRQIGTDNNYLRNTNYGFFVEDNWKVTSRLTLDLGLRYELLKPPIDKYGALTNFIPGLGVLVVGSNASYAGSGVTFSNGEVVTASQLGLPPALVYTNYKGLAPRIGFAWRPLESNRLVVRGGYGIFYGGQYQNILRTQLADAFPFVLTQSISSNKSNPLYLTLANPFPAAINLNGDLSTLALNGSEEHAPAPYLQSWNMTVERQIGSSTALEVSYTGSKGTHFPINVNINQPFRSAQYAPNFPVPYPGFSTINYFSFEDNSNYNAGYVTLRRRFVHGFFYTLNYTFSKCIGVASQVSGASDAGANGLQDARDMKADRGRCDWDINRSFTASFSWTAPFRHNPVVRGWQVTGTSRLYSGAPFTPAVTNSNLALGQASRPNRIGKGTVPNPNVNQWFNVADFPQVPSGSFTFGNSGRNILDGPGRIEINLGLFRNFAVRERSSFQFRWEVFNALNHANFAEPITAVNAANAGTITSASNGRLMQLGLKYLF